MTKKGCPAKGKDGRCIYSKGPAHRCEIEDYKHCSKNMAPIVGKIEGGCPTCKQDTLYDVHVVFGLPSDGWLLCSTCGYQQWNEVK
jgi:hypothetical protein